MRTKAQFDRKPGSVFVKVNPPKAGHVANARRQDWKLIAHEMIAEVQRPTTPPVEKQISTPETPKQPLAELLQEVDAVMEAKPALSQGQEIILKALRKSTHAQDLESIEYMTGLNSLYILLSCREMAKLGFVEIVSTLTVRKFRASEVC